jgi:predicted O-methyltransferase YrrM
MSVRKTLIDLLYDGVDPFVSWPKSKTSTDVLPQGWGSTHPYFKKYIEQLKPNLIVEIGTWLGGSAIHMGHLLREAGLNDSCIVCVDTWLGSADHYLAPEFRGTLKLVNGRPTFYDDFMRNVAEAGLQDLILPFSIASTGAAEVLRASSISPDLVYLDGDHTSRGFRADLDLYWERLRPGGCLIGDDFDWEQIHMNVLEFAFLQKIEFTAAGNKFVMHKPA